MPLYRITFTLKYANDGRKDRFVKEYRNYPEADIDKVWKLLETKCRNKWRDRLTDFECVIFSRWSSDYQEYRSRLKKNRVSSYPELPPIHPQIRGADIQYSRGGHR